MGVRGQPPEEIDYVGSAESLKDVWIAVRVNLRNVLEHVTVADVASGRLPKQVLAADPRRGGLGGALRPTLRPPGGPAA